MVVADMSMSLDGFIAHPTDGVEHLVGWYSNGEVKVTGADPRWTFHMSQASAGHVRHGLATVGALLCGRRLYDDARGWGGNHPAGVPVFVVTHTVPAGRAREEGPFTFVTDGLESAVLRAKASAGTKTVTVVGADIAQQCLNAGLLDEIRLSLVPVLLGEGTRFFDNLTSTPVLLDGPKVIEGTGVTHLYYRVASR
ncbi:dihydrofolate reductase family protein [Streptomyces sp. MST-110588]|uniref:dihydrofolate reductase family protein n=1 Tax=Streptomyces sp. MST-110588 TaxID=2833628 RepID=UPI0024142B29|nr:dihydrofolate reductase family protein [Streptomyces sp. MST-110588]